MGKCQTRRFWSENCGEAISGAQNLASFFDIRRAKTARTKFPQAVIRLFTELATSCFFKNCVSILTVATSCVL